MTDTPTRADLAALLTKAADDIADLIEAIDAAQQSPAALDDLDLTAIRAALTAKDERIAALEGEVDRLREALVQHNDRLRSAAQVAARDGQDTNWLTFRGQIHFTLAEYHDLTNTARAALKGTDHDPASKGEV